MSVRSDEPQLLGVLFPLHFLLTLADDALGAALFATLPSDFLGVPRCAEPSLPLCLTPARCNSSCFSVQASAAAMSLASVESGSTGRRTLPTADMKRHLRALWCLVRMGPSCTLVIGIHSGCQTTRTSLHPSVVDVRSAKMACTSPNWSALG